MILSRGKQLLLYTCLAVFGILFFIYFFQQASVMDFIDQDVTSPSAQRRNYQNVELDPEIFQSDKFRNLRFDKLPTVNFNAGKRNPFEPY